MDELLALLPPIRRMRGPRLYAADGRRFLDLWMDDGRGLLGEADRASRKYAGNAADKGLLRPYPGLYDRRFEKAVLAAWPGFAAMRVYRSEERALAAAARVNEAPARLIETTHPPFETPGHPAPWGAVALARPFAQVPDTVHLALPRLPCPAPFSPACLMARDPAALDGERGDIVPAMLLYAASRGLDSLARAAETGYDETLWKRFDKRMTRFFHREGPWLYPLVPRERHAAFFRAALEGGALVSPRPDAPSAVPADFDDGELARLARALEEVMA